MYISFFCVDFFALGSKRKPNSQWNIGGVGCLALGLCVGHVHFMRQVTQTLPNAIPLFGGIWALEATADDQADCFFLFLCRLVEWAL